MIPNVSKFPKSIENDRKNLPESRKISGTDLPHIVASDPVIQLSGHDFIELLPKIPPTGIGLRPSPSPSPSPAGSKVEGVAPHIGAGS